MEEIGFDLNLLLLKMNIEYLITIGSNAEEKLAKLRELIDKIKEKIQSWLKEMDNEV